MPAHSICPPLKLPSYQGSHGGAAVTGCAVATRAYLCAAIGVDGLRNLEPHGEAVQQVVLGVQVVAASVAVLEPAGDHIACAVKPEPVKSGLSGRRVGIGVVNRCPQIDVAGAVAVGEFPVGLVIENVGSGYVVAVALSVVLFVEDKFFIKSISSALFLIRLLCEG